MKNIIIVCAGSTAQEVYFIIKSINKHAEKMSQEAPYNILGFLSDVPNALDGSGIQEKIIGTIQDWQPIGDEVYAMGLSDPKEKEKLATLLKKRGCKFETLISPSCDIWGEITIGEGCIIMNGVIENKAILGDFVNIQGSAIGQYSKIGDYSTTTAYANIPGSTLGKRVFVGSHAVVLNRRRVGDDAFICAGSIVVSNVKPGTKVFGVPAKRVDW